MMGDVIPFRRKRRDVRPLTISVKRVSLRAHQFENEIADLRLADVGPIDRPKKRGDCERGERPCPFVSCKYHLALEVDPKRGSIKIRFPDLDVDELPETCALDVADGGPQTLDRTGELMNMTRERVRQIENTALRHLAEKARHLREGR